MHALHLLASADRRGAEVFGSQLAERLGASGFRNDLVALSAAHDPAAGLPVEVLPALRKVGALRELRRRARGADVVLGHGSHGLVAGTLATVGTRTPLVYRSIGDPTYWGSSRARRARVGIQLRRAARVTALWPAAADAIAAAYGVPRHRIEVVPNAADERRFPEPDPARRAAARTTLGLDAHPSAPVILAIGALSPEKRVGLAIQAVAALPDGLLLIAGDGPERASIEAQAAELLPRRHRILGSVDEVGPLYDAADVVVLTSATEGQPGVAIEAGLSARPLVATDVGGVSSVVVHGQTGVLVPAEATPEDLAAALTRALAEADALGGAARARCLADFTLTVVAERFAAVLTDAVRTGRRG